MKRLTLSLSMVRALRAGAKTQTRRVTRPRFDVGETVAVAEPCTISLRHTPNRYPYLHCEYAAGGAVTLDGDAQEIARCSAMKTVINRTPRSARFMPGWAERSRVRITEIRQEALGVITEADAVREGFADRAAFLAYFGTLHKGPIDLNRPVWVVSFEVLP